MRWRRMCCSLSWMTWASTMSVSARDPHAARRCLAQTASCWTSTTQDVLAVALHLHDGLPMHHSVVDWIPPSSVCGCRSTRRQWLSSSNARVCVSRLGKVAYGESALVMRVLFVPHDADHARATHVGALCSLGFLLGHDADVPRLRFLQGFTAAGRLSLKCLVAPTTSAATCRRTAG